MTSQVGVLGAGDSGTMSASPILMLFMLIIESCCLVPVTRNSVLASFRRSLSSAIHFFMSIIHRSMAIIALVPVLLLRTKPYIKLCIVGERMSPRQMFCDDVEQFAGVYSPRQEWNWHRSTNDLAFSAGKWVSRGQTETNKANKTQN